MKRPRLKFSKWLTLVLAGLVIATAVVVSQRHRSQPQTVGTEPVITHSTDHPNESKKTADNYVWRGKPDEPKKLRIAKINVDAYIQQAGIDQNKKVAVPNNVHLASWFVDSVRPGLPGLSIIDGHVSGKTTDGVFKRLAQLKAGDRFEIELGNGNLLHYQVVEKVQLKENESAAYLFSQKSGISNQLNLITCGGTFNRQQNQFDDRIIVAASQL